MATTVNLLRRAADAFDKQTRSKGCVAYDSNAPNPTYNYVPDLGAGIVYTVVFAFITVGHIWQTLKSRNWWYSAFAIGALGELMGWAARTAAYSCPYNGSLFSLQISILIISPCFFSAGLYYILSRLITQYGRRFSFISARLYLIIFSSFDVISIAIQGTGGGLAASAGNKVPPKSPNTGTHIMLVGIAIQLISMGVFVIFWFYFLQAARAVPYSRVLAATVSFSALCIVVRNIYRCVELAEGFHGYLSSHEAYFDVLDSALMVLAVGVFNFFHPFRYLKFKGVGAIDSEEFKDMPMGDRSQGGQ